jgi:hypothetical protein
MGSPSFDPINKKIYYLHGRNICCADLNGKNRILAQYPKDQMTAYTHLSKDGSKLCVPTVDAKAFEGITNNIDGYRCIDKRFRQNELNAYIRVYDTESGKEICVEKLTSGWITHVQFAPHNNKLILYNHEWASDWGVRRMWLWDGEKHIQLRSEGDGRNKNDFMCHEIWEPDSKSIIYHGSYIAGKNKGKNFIGRIDIDTNAITEIPLEPFNKGYGHFISGGDSWLVTDGYYWNLINRMNSIVQKLMRILFGFKVPKKFSRGFPLGIWISILKVDWEKKQIKWVPLCRHDSFWKDQDDNPHPIFNNDRTAVYFTSDKDGPRTIYKINIPSNARKSCE